MKKIRDILIIAATTLLITAYIIGMYVQVKDSPSMKGTGLDIKKKAVVVFSEAKKDPITVVKAFREKGGPKTLINVLALITFAGAMFYLMKSNKPKRDERGIIVSNSGTHGTAKFAKPDDLPPMYEYAPLKKTNGIILGQFKNKVVYLPYDTIKSNKHIAITGSSGSMKSRFFIRINVLALLLTGQSMIFTDPKGELVNDLRHILIENGYTVKVLNFVSFNNSDGWNPFDVVKDQIMAQIFAHVIVSNTEGARVIGDPSIWDKCERNLIMALALYVSLELPEENCNMGSFYDLGINAITEYVYDLFMSLPAGHPAKAPYQIFLSADDEMRSGIVLGFGVRLQLFQIQEVRKIFSHSDIDLVAPAKGKMAYFCVVPDQHSAFDFLSSMFFSLSFIKQVEYADRKGGRCDFDINYFLEEFPNIGIIPDFLKKLNTIRSRGLVCYIIFQGVARLQSRYPGKEWESILDACDTLLFLGCNEMTTAEYISNMLGTLTVVTESSQVQAGVLGSNVTSNGTLSESKRALLDPSEVRRLSKKKAIIISSYDPIMVKKIDYTKHPLRKQIKKTLYVDYFPTWANQRAASMQEEIEAGNRELAEARSEARALAEAEKEAEKIRKAEEKQTQKEAEKKAKEEKKKASQPASAEEATRAAPKRPGRKPKAANEATPDVKEDNQEKDQATDPKENQEPPRKEAQKQEATQSEIANPAPGADSEVDSNRPKGNSRRTPLL